jgi:hypothetical protein
MPIISAQEGTAMEPGKTLQVFGYVVPDRTQVELDILGQCFGGMNFVSDCTVCGWGSGGKPNPYAEMEMPRDDEVESALIGGMPWYEHESCMEKCIEYEREPHTCDPPIDPNTLKPDPITGVRAWPTWSDDNNLPYAPCAERCALACEGNPQCDAFSFRPRKDNINIPDAEGAQCAMYDFSNKDADLLPGQLDCERVEEDGGGNPLDGHGYHWMSTSLNSAKGGLENGWCLQCCDSTRTDWDFKETFAMRCSIEKNSDDVPVDPPLYTNGIRSHSEIMNLYNYAFVFGRRETSTDTTLTRCVLNRHVKIPYLIGYNLTIGVQEYFQSGKYWRGVNYCYAEPIVATSDYWANIRGDPYFTEVITLTNGPDPYALRTPKENNVIIPALACTILVAGLVAKVAWDDSKKPHQV